jgi:hypothetical protein
VDVGNYWAENKRFLVTVGIGAAVFFAGWGAIDAYLGSELTTQRARKSRIDSDLRAGMYTAADLDKAEQQNQALLAACEALRKNVEFVARPEFRIESGMAATSRYFSVIERTRDDLEQRCSRAGFALPNLLGMPQLPPTKEVELARYLEALDAVEQVVGLAIESGCRRVDEIKVKLDPRLVGGRVIEDAEKTLVEIRMTGESLPLTRLLVALQDASKGRVLPVEQVSVEPARVKSADEVKMELVLSILHLHRVGLAREAAE